MSNIKFGDLYNVLGWNSPELFIHITVYNREEDDYHTVNLKHSKAIFLLKDYYVLDISGSGMSDHSLDIMLTKEKPDLILHNNHILYTDWK